MLAADDPGVSVAFGSLPPLSEPETAPLRVLVVEDNRADAVLVREMLADAGPGSFRMQHAAGVAEAKRALVAEEVDCVLLDLSLPDAEGLEALTQVRTAALDTPVIVLSGRNDETLAVRAVQEGAQDYLIKGHVDSRLLARSINYAVQRKRVEAELAHQALHDTLTGLPNRALFMDRLGQAVTRLHRTPRGCLAVLFLDLDRFKVVNDSMGHGAGDRLLLAVAQRLEGMVRAGDTAARFGGDEFTLVCDVAGAHHAMGIAERIGEVFAAPFEVDGEEVFVRTSIGIALASDGRARPESLVRDADAAMYRAKERGGGVFELFDDEMRADAVRRLETENALHRALDRGQFHLVYQPQYRLATGELCGVEALVRWRHPERGVLLPGEFIPTAEETGLIVELGTWVFAEACRQSAEWAAAGMPVAMSVNLSARQCAQPDLLERFDSLLAASGADPSLLCLEVTETALLEDLETNVAILSALRRLGLSLALDDFGTGWSSLRALQRFPVDAVKIDRSFVAGIERSPQEAAIVAAVVSLAHALELRCVAEGVECVGQLDRLRALGCDAAQGFHLGRPQTAQAITARLGRAAL